jgi:hypothetical protein
VTKSQRARGSNRGGCGGGYEQTSDTYDSDRLREMRQAYLSLDPKWRGVMLQGLSRFEREVVAGRAQVPA